ncbi:uncharacterized protein LOC132038134 [Lycium ferocissimum]|uniref:uncharacterized protein LOC132038134 n=1 Tax=Lycium ferocissimum TaxID=112874 RepID=UPI0028155BC9|nr:uncharacterized protein LOC132038134 [Lycium ferocissimum]
MVEDFLEVFMDDFYIVWGFILKIVLAVRVKSLKKMWETNLVLNWEKCHFMVKEEIVLDPENLRKGNRGRSTKIDVIAKHPPLSRSKLLGKEAKFDDKYRKAFEELKERLTTASIIVVPDWSLPFELMCDASGFAMVLCLGEAQ